MLFRHSFLDVLQGRSIRSAKAFTLVELLILTAILSLLACVLIPCLARQKHHARVQACFDNLKQVGVAFRTWAVDQSDLPSTGVSVTSGGTLELAASGQAFIHLRAMSNELSSPGILICPCDQMKTVASNFNCGFSDSNVSYFVSPDARDVFPQMLQTGDRNLAFEDKPLEPGVFVWTSNMSTLSWTKAIHNRCGNVGLADGSIHFCDSKKLGAALWDQDCATNRLAIP
jgi:Competence protein ComGC